MACSFSEKHNRKTALYKGRGWVMVVEIFLFLRDNDMGQFGSDIY